MATSDSTIPRKRCTKCNQWKALSEFHKWSRSPDGLKPACKACRCADQRQYRADHPEEHRERNRDWEARNRERVNARLRKYAAENPEKVRETKRKSAEKHSAEIATKRQQPEHKARKQAYDKARYLMNPDIVRERVRQWRMNNPERAKEADRNWRIAHPELVRIYGHARRARQQQAGGRYTADDVQTQYRSQRGLCWWCGQLTGDDYHIDHRIPLSRGGRNDAGNIVISCPKCNLQKNNKLPHEWNGRLL